jgi:hypothetical protein
MSVVVFCNADVCAVMLTRNSMLLCTLLITTAVLILVTFFYISHFPTTL